MHPGWRHCKIPDQIFLRFYALPAGRLNARNFGLGSFMSTRPSKARANGDVAGDGQAAS